jgi:hypothetical protein
MPHALVERVDDVLLKLGPRGCAATTLPLLRRDLVRENPAKCPNQGVADGSLKMATVSP